MQALMQKNNTTIQEMVDQSMKLEVITNVSAEKIKKVEQKMKMLENSK